LTYFRILWCHETVGSNKIVWFSAGKFHIFVTALIIYLSLLIEGQKSESMAVEERLEGKFFAPYFSAKPSHCSCKPVL
jgi:hypothetical protein